MKVNIRRIQMVGQPPTLEQIMAVTKETDRAIFPVVGCCLEAVGVIPGGYVAVDFTRFPAPPRYKSKGGDGSTDLCACWAVFPGQSTPAFMLKEYLGVWGNWQMVSTRYDLTKNEHQMDCGMEAERIFGVIVSSWDSAGRLLWERSPESFPERLGTAQTIHGENVGNPVEIRRIPSGIAARARA